MISLLCIGLVETLWSYLKAQVLHCLKDMVVALEHIEVEVAECIVTFLVVNIHKRCNLRKLVGYMLQQSHCTFLIAWLVIMELYKYHPFACIRVAHHNVAQ